MSSFEELNDCIIKCRLCPRLVAFREAVPPKKAFENEFHCRRPVTGFGDVKAQVFIVGLAPSIDGGNRTGRIFTGDNSARFLIPMLYAAGFANQPISESADDGLRLINCYLTPAVKCVPPGHKPLREELVNCSQYYAAELRLLKHVRCVLALGKFAFEAHLRHLHSVGVTTPKMTFHHGAHYQLNDGTFIVCAYHPSPQNTQTGKLTPAMFQQVLISIKEKL